MSAQLPRGSSHKAWDLFSRRRSRGERHHGCRLSPGAGTGERGDEKGGPRPSIETDALNLSARFEAPPCANCCASTGSPFPHKRNHSILHGRARSARSLCCVLDPAWRPASDLRVRGGSEGSFWFGKVGAFPGHTRCFLPPVPSWEAEPLDLIHAASSVRTRPDCGIGEDGPEFRPLDCTTGH